MRRTGIRRLPAVQQRALNREYAQAVADAAFVSEMTAVVEAFDIATLDGLVPESV